LHNKKKKSKLVSIFAIIPFFNKKNKNKKICNRSRVQRFRGSEVDGFMNRDRAQHSGVRNQTEKEDVRP